MASIAELMQSAKQGTISDEEVAECANLLIHAPGEAAYQLLYCIGRSFRVAYRPLIERFANHDDVELARLALEILCTYWGLATHYRATILQRLSPPVRGDDDMENLQFSAMGIAGPYLQSSPDPEVYRALLAILDDPDQRYTMRVQAYSALCKAAGASSGEVLRLWMELPQGPTDPSRREETMRAFMRDEAVGKARRIADQDVADTPA